MRRGRSTTFARRGATSYRISAKTVFGSVIAPTKVTTVSSAANHAAVPPLGQDPPEAHVPCAPVLGDSAPTLGVLSG
jgi:hypothetical protein